MHIRGFIFDLDGVLTDTAEFHYRAWKQLADEEGIPFNRRENEALRGVSRRESLLILLKGRVLSEELMQAWTDRKNTYYRNLLMQMSPDDMLPGARELLAEIHQAGYYKIALASASKNAGDVIARLNFQEYIDVICDGYSAARAKPAPDLFLCAAEKLGLPPGQCVVFEDAEAGIAAAKAAGMLTVGLGPQERVGQADLVLPSLENVHLKELLESLKIE